MLKSRKVYCNGKARSAGSGVGGALCATLLLTLALGLFAGCGASGGTDSSGGGTAQAPSGAKSFAKDTEPESKKIVGFGQEGSSSDREAASAVLTQNLKARQAADFAGQCSSLGKAGLESVGPVQAGQLKKARAECPSSLKALAEPLASSKSARKNTLSGPIAALRVEGEKAYALYHGNDGNDYAMPMEKEGGKWLVGSIVTQELG